MIFEIEKDAQLIYDVMTHPDIWERITDDSARLETFLPPQGMYLTGRIDGELVGMVRVEPINSTSFKYHPMVLPEMRKHSIVFHNESVKTIKKLLSDIQLFVFIPVCFRSVILGSAWSGWKRAGKLENAILKNNKLHDIQIMQYAGAL